MATIQRITVPGLLRRVSHYCHVTRAGANVFVAGVAGVAPAAAAADTASKRFAVTKQEHIMPVATIPKLGYLYMRQRLAFGEKPLDWIGSSKHDFLAFLPPVQRDMGNALGLAQLGGKHPNAEPWKGEGPGVFEVVDDFDGDTYRAVYTVRFRQVVNVLHAFQKKSPRGNRTAHTDVELITRRLKQARQDYEEHYGKSDRQQGKGP